MPTYKVKPEQDYPITAMPGKGEKNKKRYPTVNIPVSPEIIAALKVGGDVEVTLKGKVRGLESRQSTDNDPYNNRNELRVELRVVDAYQAEGGADDEEEEAEPTMKDAIDKGLGYKK
jgi:hypothetical protein